MEVADLVLPLGLACGRHDRDPPLARVGEEDAVAGQLAAPVARGCHPRVFRRRGVHAHEFFDRKGDGIFLLRDSAHDRSVVAARELDVLRVLITRRVERCDEVDILGGSRGRSSLPQIEKIGGRPSRT